MLVEAAVHAGSGDAEGAGDLGAGGSGVVEGFDGGDGVVGQGGSARVAAGSAGGGDACGGPKIASPGDLCNVADSPEQNQHGHFRAMVAYRKAASTRSQSKQG